jgi:hypothetical protein
MSMSPKPSHKTKTLLSKSSKTESHMDEPSAAVFSIIVTATIVCKLLQICDFKPESKALSM